VLSLDGGTWPPPARPTHGQELIGHPGGELDRVRGRLQGHRTSCFALFRMSKMYKDRHRKEENGFDYFRSSLLVCAARLAGNVFLELVRGMGRPTW